MKTSHALLAWPWLLLAPARCLVPTGRAGGNERQRARAGLMSEGN